MNLSERIWKALLKSWGAAFSIVSVLGTIAVYFVAPDEDLVRMNIFFSAMFLFVVVIIILLRTAYDANLDASIVLPKIRKILEPPKSYEKATALLLIDPSNFLSYDSSVTLFILEDDYESFIGVGAVINIQNDGKIQVALFTNEDSNQIMHQLKENRKHDLERLVLKPSVPRALLEGDL